MNCRALPIAAAAVAMICAGCKSENAVWRGYPSTTFAELTLPKRASLRIVSSKDPTAKAFAAKLRTSLADSGLSVVSGAEEATHLVYVQGAAGFRADTPEQAKYTGRVSVETKETDSGSFQRILRKGSSTHAAAREISLAVYEVKTLAPVDFLSFPMWDGGETDGSRPGASSGADEERAMQDRFAALAVKRLEEVFSTQRRSIKVPVPVEADGALKIQFIKIESAVAAGDEEELGRALARIDELAASPAVLPGTLEEFAAASASDGWEPPEGSSREAILGNYYLVALRREIGCTDPDVLSEIHSEMLRILEMSEDPTLLMACPIALARLEGKMARSRRR